MKTFLLPSLKALSLLFLVLGISWVSYGRTTTVRFERNQYAYKLEGVHEAWIDLGTERSVTFPSLDPGSYILRIRGSNNYGLWNEADLAVPVRVVPLLCGTWWFSVLGMLTSFLLILAAFQIQTRKIRKRNRHLEGLNTRLNQEIIERECAQAALGIKNVELKSKNEELEVRNAEMERFTYTVSHDLKTPLVTIKGFLSLLQQDAAAGNTDRMARDIEQIASATDKMARLLAELLELSRIGRLMNPPEAVELSELASEAAGLVAGQIEQRGVAVEIATEMPVVSGDRVRLLEVYQNLIDNAVKFTGAQAEPRIEVGAHRNGAEVLCYVRDNGIGIAPKYQEKVFGLFDQLNPGGEGTGIGLALVRRIVEVHGGKIWVDSEGEGQGTTFYFTLPWEG